MDTIAEIENNKLVVFHIQSDKSRRIVHQYFEKYHPEIHRSSLRCKCFPKRDGKIMMCLDCGAPMRLTYNYGIMDNNRDQWYSGDCDYCGSYDSFDCDCSTGVFYRKESNCIVFSEGIIYNNKTIKFVEPDLSTALTILESSTKYVIDNPPLQHSFSYKRQIINMGKKELAQYISDQLSKKII